MAKLTVGSFVAGLTLATVALAQAPNAHVLVLPGGENAVRNLLLNAAGTQTPKPGEIRIPIPVEGVNYEAIVKKPGEPKLIRVKTKDAD